MVRLFLFLSLALMSASSSSLSEAKEDDDICPNVSEGEPTGIMHDLNIRESSGLAEGRLAANRGVLFTHNDSGNPRARVFAVDSQGGATRAEFRLPEIVSFDTEDIAAGRQDGVDYLYLADMGNNFEDRNVSKVLRFREPDVSLLPVGSLVEITDFDTFVFQTELLPNEDAEALLFDQVSEYLYVIQKNHDEPDANIYKFKPEGASTRSNPILAETVGNFPYQNINGGDISSDGTRILLRNYDEGYMWVRPDPESLSVEDVLTGGPPCILQLQQEKQGEALAVSVDQEGFYTASEGVLQPIWYYEFED